MPRKIDTSLDISEIIKATYKKKFPETFEMTDETGYHLDSIPHGVLGEPSKILEETLEFMDSIKQKVDIMALLELSDLYGAIESYLEKHHPSITMDALKAMSDVTKRAFSAGHR